MSFVPGLLAQGQAKGGSGLKVGHLAISFQQVLSVLTSEKQLP